ncbi:S41 family peptidase [Pedobacter metabolipauper]|uniref:Peptidase S41-like protein n=1 Tax=Pedobacter metabolipauper TaxID=425513 RepID=A0A4R6T2Y4_9SPHI|nr:S41 family peptidase [Pedobacter metabolipauper]TDQ11731.1 peptidase S41-like protein [Pedobacter metabolipauper]
MKIKTILSIAILFVTNMVYAQSICECDDALDRLIKKIESEYPGFEEKTKDKILYDSFKQQLKEQASNAEKAKCFDILKKYTSFFRDGHIWINPATSINTKGIVSTDRINMDIEKFRKRLKATQNPLEGIWKNKFEWTGGVGYEIGITKNNDGVQVGFVISSTSAFWKPNETKFRLYPNGKFEFYSFDKTLKTGSYGTYNNSIIYFKEVRAVFIKETPPSNLTEEQVKRKVGEFYGFGIKKLSDKTTLLTLPSFDYPFVSIIEDLVTNNLSLLEEPENLIIDIRGNSGGTDDAYQILLPYIMSNSIRNMGVEYLATQTLVNGLESYIKTVYDNKEKQEEIEMVRRWIGLFEKDMGKFVNVKDSTFSIQNVTFPKRSPGNVVVLTDKRVGSSAESFVMKAKQSKKVKIAGTVTSGGLDYAAARMFDFGCPEYMLQLPTYRSLRLPDYPIDNIGMQPDIYLDKSIKDWVQFALEYLEQ